MSCHFGAKKEHHANCSLRAPNHATRTENMQKETLIPPGICSASDCRKTAERDCSERLDNRPDSLNSGLDCSHHFLHSLTLRVRITCCGKNTTEGNVNQPDSVLSSARVGQGQKVDVGCANQLVSLLWPLTFLL